MSYINAVYELLLRNIEAFHAADGNFDGAKLVASFEGKCGFSGQATQGAPLHQTYTRYLVRGVSYVCEAKTKDRYGNKTTTVVSEGFLPIRQQAVEVSVTQAAVSEFLQKQYRSARIAGNIPLFIVLLYLVLNLCAGLFLFALYVLYPFLSSGPLGGLFSILASAAVGIVLPIIVLTSFIGRFIKKRKIIRAGTDLRSMDEKQRSFIEETITEHLHQMIKTAVHTLWYHPKKDASIIVDTQWTLDTHNCISRLDYRLMEVDKQDEMAAIMEAFINARRNRAQVEQVVASLWS